jgi:hypothetical protein
MSSGERIVLVDRQHWFVVLANGRYGVAAMAVLVWEVLRYQNQQYVITNRRVLQVSGVINKHSGDSSLEKINDADLSQSVLGRMFNFGDLDVLTAADAGIDRMRMIHDPVGFKRTMLDAKHEYEMDMARGPAPVSPPLRAGAPARQPEAFIPNDPDATSAHAVPVPAGGPPAERPVDPAPPRPPEPVVHATPRMTADEVTRTLASLADLRDRGAISPEEYDLKKADLLDRL